MISIPVLHLIDSKTVALPQFRFLSYHTGEFRNPRPEDRLLFVFRHEMSFPPHGFVVSHQMHYTAWLGVARLIDATEQVLVVRTIDFDRDVPVLGFAEHEPQSATVIADPWEEDFAEQVVHASEFARIRDAIGTVCLSNHCVLLRSEPQSKLCEWCEKLLALQEARAKADAERKERRRKKRLELSREEMEEIIAEEAQHGRTARCPGCGGLMPSDADLCDYCSEEEDVRTTIMQPLEQRPEDEDDIVDGTFIHRKFDLSE